MGIFSNASDSHASDIVSLVDTAALHDAVLSAVGAGWLLSFGSSRDGGAVSVAVVNDEGKDRVWCGTADELERVLRALVAAADGQPGQSSRPAPSEAPAATEAPQGASPQVRTGRKRGA